VSVARTGKLQSPGYVRLASIESSPVWDIFCAINEFRIISQRAISSDQSELNPCDQFSRVHSKILAEEGS